MNDSSSKYLSSNVSAMSHELSFSDTNGQSEQVLLNTPSLFYNVRNHFSNPEFGNTNIEQNASSFEIENTDFELVLLEPLFSDTPAVSHRFTRKVQDILVIFLAVVIAMMLFLMIILGDFIDNSSETHDDCCIDNFVANDACLSDDDTTADSKIDYTNLHNFLNFFKFFVQSTKFITLRSHVELDRWGRPGVWYLSLIHI